MRLDEIEQGVDDSELEALTQFLIGRAGDTNAQKQISVDAFLRLAQSMGISLSKDQLITAIQQPPLSNLIDNIQGNDIVFAGAQVPDSTMSVDKARDTVNKMAKRALNKKGL
jgi:hypothetical protein